MLDKEGENSTYNQGLLVWLDHQQALAIYSLVLRWRIVYMGT